MYIHITKTSKDHKKFHRRKLELCITLLFEIFCEFNFLRCSSTLNVSESDYSVSDIPTSYGSYMNNMYVRKYIQTKALLLMIVSVHTCILYACM